MNILSLVFSFRNEAEVLPELLRRTRAVLKEEQEKGIVSDYELIFVNDASTDSSLNILLNASEGHNDIRIINMSRRFGVSPCVLAGLEYSSGDAVIYMDADLQDPPETIPELLRLWKNDGTVDVIHTVRCARKGETWLKLFVTKIGYLILNKMTSIKLPVEAGDFKLLSRRAVNHLVRLREKKPFMRGLICWIGFKQEYIYYDRQPRGFGKTKFPIFSPDVINNFLESALISFSSVPLRFASLVGFLSIVLSFLMLGHVFLEKIQGKAIPGWTAIMVTVIFIGGIQLFCIGIIALYLSSMYEEGKKRPNFIVESTYGFPSSNAGREKREI